MKSVYIFIASMLIVSFSFSADGKTLYKKCQGCHGMSGKHIPFEREQGVLAGRDKVEIELIIRAINDGSYTGDKLNKIMKKTINQFSDEEIKNVSEYIGNFKN